MAQSSGALAALLENVGSIPSTYMALRTFCNSSSGDLIPSAGLHGHCTHVVPKHKGRQNTHTHKK